MKEREFLHELEKRVIENKKLIKKSNVAFILSFWLGDHPWRIIIPFSFLLTLFFRLIFGKSYFESILWIFGGL